MAAFKFKVAYTVDPAKVQPSLDAGIIDAGDLVIVNDNGVGKLCFITEKNEVLDCSNFMPADEQELEKVVTQVVTDSFQDVITDTVQDAVQEALQDANVGGGSWGDF